MAVALRTGRQPLFFSANDELSWEACLAGPYRGADAVSSIHSVASGLDPRLVNVWRDLHAFAMALNLAHETKNKIAPDLLQQVLISVHYRLHRLSVEHRSDSKDSHAVMRLAMLAFSTTIFLEVHRDSFQLLADETRSALNSWRIRQQKKSQLVQSANDDILKLHLWITFVAAVSVLDGPEDHAWLRAALHTTIGDLGMTNWPAVRTILKQFLWVDAVNDSQGQEFFLSLPT